MLPIEKAQQFASTRIANFFWGGIPELCSHMHMLQPCRRTQQGEQMAEPKASRPGRRGNGDFFYRDKIFPDAKALLEYRQRPIEELKDACLVAIDTNVLLVPYQLDKQSLGEIIKVYKSLNAEKRLILPGQAVREFVSLRSEKLGDIVKYLRKEASQLKRPLQNKIGLLDDDETFRKAKDISIEIVNSAKTLSSMLNQLADNLSARVGEDPVSVAYSSLTEAVRDLSLNEEQQAEFLENLEWRHAHKIPPGYMDADKPTGGTGDLLIWKTLLKEGEKEGKDLIFATNEEKQDWWVRSQGAFKPRLELLEEYRAATGGHTIHIMPLSKLLKLFEVEQETVANVRGAEKANTVMVTLDRVSPTRAEYHFFRGEVQPEQARQLAVTREKLRREAADTQQEIQNWEARMRWLSADQRPQHVRTLRERLDQLRAQIDWIDGQLRLTSPPEDSLSATGFSISAPTLDTPSADTP
jgi:hypothetical protein